MEYAGHTKDCAYSVLIMEYTGYTKECVYSVLNMEYTEHTKDCACSVLNLLHLEAGQFIGVGCFACYSLKLFALIHNLLSIVRLELRVTSLI